MNYSQQFVHPTLIVIIFRPSFAALLKALPTTCTEANPRTRPLLPTHTKDRFEGAQHFSTELPARS